MKVAKAIYKSVRKLPHPIVGILKAVAESLPGGNEFRQWYNAELIDACIISFPKCGRTWLRLLIGKALSLHFGLEANGLTSELLEISELHRLHPRIPLIEVTHDDNPHHKCPYELSTDKRRYRGKKVILLVRDPRDVIVSNYFEYTKRKGKHYAGDDNYQDDLSSYLRYERGSLDSFIRFYNIWARNRHIPSHFRLVRYEDMHEDAARELRRVLEFLGFSRVGDVVVHEAVQFASFENMHKMEAQDALQSNRLRPGDKNDPESYKTRRGKVGGYVDYLSKEDIIYLDQRIRAQLDSCYGYQRAPIG